MKDETTDRIIYRAGKIGIGQTTYGWFTCILGETGAKSKRPGVESIRQQQFWPSLPSACEQAALQMADQAKAQSLDEYAQYLREAIAELKTAVGCPENARRLCERPVSIESDTKGAGSDSGTLKTPRTENVPKRAKGRMD